MHRVGFDDRGIGLFIGSGRTLILTFSCVQGEGTRDAARCSSMIKSSPVGKWKGRIKLVEGGCVEEDGLRWVAHRVDGDRCVNE